MNALYGKTVSHTITKDFFGGKKVLATNTFKVIFVSLKKFIRSKKFC